MSTPRNEEQEEAIRADLKIGAQWSLGPEQHAARKRLKAAGFRRCAVRFEVIGAEDPDAIAVTVARDDDEARERGAGVLRSYGITGPIIPLSVKWDK